MAAMRRTKQQQPVADLSALRVVSVRQLCSLLGIHRATAHRWSLAGVLPAPIQLGPGRIGWTEKSITKWIQSRPPVVGAPTPSEAA